MITVTEIKNAVLHLFFPHVCVGCGNDILADSCELCMRCVDAMPETKFEKYTDNPVEKLFWGRLTLEAATAQYYFSKGSLMQHLLHQFKYKGNRDLAFQLGMMMGEQLARSGRFTVDALVPLPLNYARQKRRGYNQASVLCEGIAEMLRIPILDQAIIRPQYTETQTKRGRIERWKNIEGKFVLLDYPGISGKHLLLVDDIITTGATLEACGSELLKGEGIKLSVAALCVAER